MALSGQHKLISGALMRILTFVLLTSLTSIVDWRIASNSVNEVVEHVCSHPDWSASSSTARSSTDLSFYL
ncbi:hypothetical protein KCU86_g69, partial [Aureobasidium melanogenum]